MFAEARCSTSLVCNAKVASKSIAISGNGKTASKKGKEGKEGPVAPKPNLRPPKPRSPMIVAVQVEPITLCRCDDLTIPKNIKCRGWDEANNCIQPGLVSTSTHLYLCSPLPIGPRIYCCLLLRTSEGVHKKNWVSAACCKCESSSLLTLSTV